MGRKHERPSSWEQDREADNWHAQPSKPHLGSGQANKEVQGGERKMSNICLRMHFSLHCRACYYTHNSAALLFFCVIKYSTLTFDGMSLQRYMKKTERSSERSSVTGDLIRYHNPTKQSLLIRRWHSSTVPANSSNVTRYNREEISKTPKQEVTLFLF